MFRSLCPDTVKKLTACALARDTARLEKRCVTQAKRLETRVIGRKDRDFSRKS
jgi:hypothetical protein